MLKLLPHTFTPSYVPDQTGSDFDFIWNTSCSQDNTRKSYNDLFPVWSIDDVWGFRVGGGVHDSYTFQCGLVGSFTSPDIDTIEAVSLISESPRIAANRGICTTFKLFSCVHYIKDGTCVRSTKFQIDISIVRAMN